MKDYDNFFLPAVDLEASKLFYEKTLGLPVKFDFSKQGMIAFQVGEQEPAIILKDIHKFQNAKPTIWFVVDNVLISYQNLQSQGGTFLSAPFPIKTGMAVEFEDPAGNRLGFADYTKTPA